jgi:ABC-2 type transport system ATP-binding protein
VSQVLERPVDTELGVDCRGLSRRFGDLVAVDGVDLAVGRGELFALLGPNGAGKTTMIRMLCGLLRPTAGTAQILGRDVRTDPLGVKRVIGVSPQETAIAEHLTAWENLRLMAGLHGIDRQQTRRRSAELLDMMGLAGRADERVKKYSGGMKRRLSIAMALVTDPAVLFLDEPTLGLDPQARRAIWGHIETLEGHTTVLLTTHYLEEADALADRVGVIDHGRVVALGAPAELKNQIAGARVMVVETAGLTDAALAALRGRYPRVRRTDSGVEIEADEVSLYDLEDVLRPLGIVIHATYRRQVTLDDVFLELTGKQLRE